jgi:hypothetical protein
MTLEDFNNKLDESISDVSRQLGETMVKIGQTALVRIRQRVQETGRDAKGQGFPPYSTDPMLVGCKSFRSKDCNKFFGKQKNKEHEWVTIKRGDDLYRLAVLEGGYKKLREISLGAGKGDKVDFSFTNDMWNDIHLISTSSDHNSGTVIIGALKKEEKDKLYYNTERNKNKGGLEILDLSETELNELKELFNQPILNIFK